MEGSCVCQLWDEEARRPLNKEKERPWLRQICNFDVQYCSVMISIFQYSSVFDWGPSTRSKRGLDTLDFGKSAMFGKWSNICMFLPQITLPIATEYLMQNQQPSSILNLGNSNCNFRLSWYFLWNFHQLSHKGGFISRSWNYKDATEELRKETEKNMLRHRHYRRSCNMASGWVKEWHLNDVYDAPGNDLRGLTNSAGWNLGRISDAFNSESKALLPNPPVK